MHDLATLATDLHSGIGPSRPPSGLLDQCLMITVVAGVTIAVVASMARADTGRRQLSDEPGPPGLGATPRGDATPPPRTVDPRRPHTGFETAWGVGPSVLADLQARLAALDGEPCAGRTSTQV